MPDDRGVHPLEHDLRFLGLAVGRVEAAARARARGGAVHSVEVQQGAADRHCIRPRASRACRAFRAAESRVARQHGSRGSRGVYRFQASLPFAVARSESDLSFPADTAATRSCGQFAPGPPRSRTDLHRSATRGQSQATGAPALRPFSGRSRASAHPLGTASPGQAPPK